MSSAAVSLATTQPRSSRPSTSGRKPSGSRAAYSVCSSMNTRENAPRTSGSTASAVLLDAWRLLAARCPAGGAGGEQRGQHVSVRRGHLGTARRAGRDASSRVLIRFPLWPRARLTAGVARNVGCAFSQTDEPVVE